MDQFIHTVQLRQRFQVIGQVHITEGLAEAQRFAHIASKDMDLGVSGHAEIADAWTLASNEVHAAQSFGSALVAIRTEITRDADKAMAGPPASVAALWRPWRRMRLT
mgnify:CR=1 FL=1